MEVKNHLQHIAVTLGNLFETLEVDPHLAEELSPVDFAEAIKKRVSWVKTSDLVTPDVTTEKMVLHHLLWLQHIGRIVIEDIDRYSGG